jgi:hypothetical protein
MVKINKEPEETQKNHYADLDYSSDDGSAMMVQASNSKQVNGITVIEVPGKEGTCHATTILIDNGFTAYAVMLGGPELEFSSSVTFLNFFSNFWSDRRTENSFLASGDNIAD